MTTTPAPTPIETQYKGYRFRSRLEARWAVFFDRLAIPWQYEPEGYIVGGRPYLPDFRLELNLMVGRELLSRVVYAEVKPEIDTATFALCHRFAIEVDSPIVLLAGPPEYRMYHLFHEEFGNAEASPIAFFTDYQGEEFGQPALTIADSYWEQYGMEFSHLDDRALSKSFGRGVVDAVHSARSARFGEHRS